MSFTRALSRRGRLARPGSRAATRRRAPRPRARITPRMRLAAVVTILLAGLLFGVWTWVRDSSLVQVEHVRINGASGADASAIRAALRSAARNMTTLDVQMNQLRTAVAPFPEVKHLRVKTEFPHRLVIDVIEQRPVALIDIGGRQAPVAADGTILRSVTVGGGLPSVPLTVPPVGRRLTEGRAGGAVAVLAAAPAQMLPKLSQVTTVAGHGFVAQLRSGPSIYFGDTTRLAAKWLAATEVLGDSGSAGASYIDVTDPSRPAAGAGSSSGPSSSGTSTGTTTPAGSTSGASTPGASTSGAVASGGSAAPSGG